MKYDMSEKELRDSLDAEVKRMAQVFRFILRYQRHFQPSGVEFSGLRQYLPSDDASRIDWKNSAGKPELYVKQYEEEVNLDVFILVDASDSMLFGTSEKLKSEYTAAVASAIAYASVDVGIDVGIGLWGDEKLVLPTSSGTDQYQKVLHEVVKSKHYGGSLNLEEALEDIIGKMDDNSSLFILSDFLNIKGDWKPNMTLASNKFRNVTNVMVRDLRDYKLPDSGFMRFQSPEEDTLVVNTSSVRKDFEEEAKKQEEMIEDKINKAGADFLKVDTRKNFAHELASYFEDNKGGA